MQKRSGGRDVRLDLLLRITHAFFPPPHNSPYPAGLNLRYVMKTISASI